MKFTKEEITGFCKHLEEKGYRRYQGHYKSEDYGYWKGFEPYIDHNGEKEHRYQIAFLIFDFSKYHNYQGDKPIGVQCEYVGNQEEYLSRLDFYVSDDDITVEEFEGMANHFYQQMFVNYVKKNFKKIEEAE
jgi:hypothetical protein